MYMLCRIGRIGHLFLFVIVDGLNKDQLHNTTASVLWLPLTVNNLPREVPPTATRSGQPHTQSITTHPAGPVAHHQTIQASTNTLSGQVRCCLHKYPAGPSRRANRSCWTNSAAVYTSTPWAKLLCTSTPLGQVKSYNN